VETLETQDRKTEIRERVVSNDIWEANEGEGTVLISSEVNRLSKLVLVHN